MTAWPRLCAMTLILAGLAGPADAANAPGDTPNTPPAQASDEAELWYAME